MNLVTIANCVNLFVMTKNKEEIRIYSILYLSSSTISEIRGYLPQNSDGTYDVFLIKPQDMELINTKHVKCLGVYNCYNSSLIGDNEIEHFIGCARVSVFQHHKRLPKLKNKTKKKKKP